MSNNRDFTKIDNETINLTREVAVELAKNGFIVQKITISNKAAPEIEIASSKLCKRLGGFLTRHTRNSSGCYDVYESSFGDIRVKWEVPTKSIV